MISLTPYPDFLVLQWFLSCLSDQFVRLALEVHRILVPHMAPDFQVIPHPATLGPLAHPLCHEVLHM